MLTYADDAVFASNHDNLNRLQSRAPGGPIVMSGTVNEAATVTIDGKPVGVDAANNFNGTAQVGPGTTIVTVKAKDASGNETTKQYEIDAAGSTTSYTYDANGNLTSDGTKTYFWNALNQLVEVKQGVTTLATFVYDGDGRRTEKTASGVTHTYLYDAEDIVEERLSGSTTDTVRYYHGAGIDEPLARKTSADVVTYYLADHLGSLVQETDAAGSVTLQREYDAWGMLLQGASASGYSFTGREWDAEIGLYYYRARYLDPASGRFVSSDPITFEAGPNFYGYVNNGPSGATDPSGLIVVHPGDVIDWWEFAEDLSSFLDCSSWRNGGWLALSTISLLPGITGLGMIDDAARMVPKLLGPATRHGDKILDQLAGRGWTKDLVQSTIDKPIRTVTARDTRKFTGGRNNDPATKYYADGGGYVVRNNRTGDIVQVSNRFNPNWKDR